MYLFTEMLKTTAKILEISSNFKILSRNQKIILVNFISPNQFKKRFKFYIFLTDYTADLSIVCKDGLVLAHQMILGAHSKLLKQLFLSQHALEFAVVDWEAGMYIIFF